MEFKKSKPTRMIFDFDLLRNKWKGCEGETEIVKIKPKDNDVIMSDRVTNKFYV